jgi:hypothetical protein
MLKSSSRLWLRESSFGPVHVGWTSLTYRTDGELEIVAELLADVVEVVHGLVGGLDSAICLLPTVVSLLSGE